MKFTPRVDFESNLSSDYLNATLMASGLSVLVLVGLFQYLNRYTQRRYFTVWTAAWLFYGLWLSFHLSWVQFPESEAWLMMKQFSVGLSATFLIWGSANFLNQNPRQTLFGSFMAFLLVWCYISAYYIRDVFYAQVPLFGLMGGASILTAAGFFRLRRRRELIGAGLLSVGFLIWGIHLAAFPFWTKSTFMLCTSFLAAAVVQLFIAVSMIILVLEEARAANESAAREIQKRKSETDRLSARVVSTEERYRSLFDQASEGILIADAEDLKILELNQTAERLLGINRAEASQHRLNSFCQPTEPVGASEDRPAKEWFATFGRSSQLRLVRRDGGATLAEVDGAPITFEGRPAYQFFFRELTERVRLEQQLRQAEKLSALGRMISGVAHELNNPLAVIKGYVDLILARHVLPEATRTDLGKVAHEANRAAKLVNNFLSFAREQPARRQSVDLNELVRRVVELRQADFRAAGVEASLQLEHPLPRTAADADQIEQVLVNLLTNAMQAMADKSDSPRIRISTQRQCDRIRIVVEDSGPGVPEPLLQQIFEPFFTTKEVGSGTGLGLSIAHSIMSDHHGAIFYQTSCYGGAAFVLEFPLVEEAATEPEPVKPTSDLAASSQNVIRFPAKVLVLDDEAPLGDLLGEILGTLGHLPTICHSGIQALQLIQKNEFDLVLSDFRMPIMDGQQFYEKVLETKPDLARRIIFLTGDVVNEATKSFLKSTGSRHLAKPFQMSAVEEAVNELLKKERGVKT